MSDAEIVKEFLVESYENLDRLDLELIALEKNPEDRETLASIFRTIHTIKGTSGFLAFNQLESVAHVGENLLAKLRDGLLTLRPEITTALLAMVDAVRKMLASIEAVGNEGKRDDTNLIAELTRLLEPAASKSPARAPIASATGAQNKPMGAAPISPEPQQKQDTSEPAQKVEAAPLAEKGETNPRNEITVERTIKPMEVQETSKSESRGQSVSDSTIRVDVGQLDRLMNGMGELVLLRNQILQYANSTDDRQLLGTSQRLNLLTTELQEGVMKTRMQPIGNVWSRFPRTVRDLAVGCGKQVRIQMEGEETELDKTIIEAIKDPMTHLVRNAVDHGIETPVARQAAGKNPEGLLFLHAFHEGGQVNIEITDDGAGLDCEKVRNKAVQKGLIGAEQASRMTEREVANLIFLPGLSTAEKVSNVSGRGVGMDVVKTNIEKIGGTVDLQSKPGSGTTVRMKIPLTLAIIPALIVTSAGDRYAIPQVSLLELVRLEGEQLGTGIEQVNGAPVHRLRGRLLPLVYLNQELKMETGAGTAGNHQGAASGKPRQLDFAAVRDKHRQWIQTLEKVLAGRLSMSVEQAGSHQSCALGQWIYSTGLHEYGAIAELHTLESVHKQFHDSVREVLRSKGDGETARAEKELADVGQFSGRIMELLTTVEGRVLEHQNANIVVLRADDRQFGLIVDEINDTEEIVVKPLSKQLKSINTYAGATIMGDGRVALILDVMGLAQRAKVVGESHAQASDKETAEAAGSGQSNAVLLFQYGESGRMAIDLALVARLEEFAVDAVERAADQEVVQYRGQIMPLVRVSQVFENRNGRPPEEALHVVVYSEKGRSVGLVVDRILDIVEESFVIERQSRRQGIIGSAVIQNRVTDILDVPGLIALASSRPLAAAQSA